MNVIINRKFPIKLKNNELLINRNHRKINKSCVISQESSYNILNQNALL